MALRFERFELSTPSAVLLGLSTIFLLRALLVPAKKSNAPAVGLTGPVGSWITAFKSLMGANVMYRKGYETHKPGSFTVRQIGIGNMVMVTSDALRDELRKAPGHELSMKAGMDDTLQADYTFGPNILRDDYHVGLITGRLSKNLDALFPEVYDELLQACNDELPVPSDGEWSSFRLADPLRRVISRTTNRVLVGLPLCRNAEWRDLQVFFTVTTMTDAALIKLFPNFLKPLVGKYLAQGPKQIRTTLQFLTPLIDERLKLSAEDRPNDFLSWLIDEAPNHPGEMEYEALARRILTLNFAAIHTTSMTAMTAIYDLASRPEYATPLREEVQEMIERYGWTKKAMGQMRKLDSFVRESQRLTGLATAGMSRVAVKDYTFSDGTFVPAGTTVAIPTHAVQTDPAIYENPTEFNGFRFSSLPDDENIRNQIVSSSINFLPYGHGTHACPGRFFAANEIKCLLAHLLVTYDMKMKDGVFPAPTYLMVNIIPNEKAEICFRKRIEGSAK